MKHPHYHLRANKAADRLILIDTVDRFIGVFDGKRRDYAYYGFGGPFLEDLKLVRKHFPDMKIVSIEEDPETYERQKLHRFCKDLELHNASLDQFLSADYEPSGKDVFWLDFLKFKPSNLGSVEQLLPNLGLGSIIKITFPAAPPLSPQALVNRSKDNRNKFIAREVEKFSSKFSKYLTAGFEKFLYTPNDYASLIFQIVKSSVASVRMSEGLMPALVAVHRYADGIPMVSCTFLIADCNTLPSIKEEIAAWPLAQFDDAHPQLLELPMLSVQERLRLDCLLPQNNPTGKSLFRRLGYSIDRDEKKSIEMLCNYAELQRYYPLFGRLEF